MERPARVAVVHARRALRARLAHGGGEVDGGCADRNGGALLRGTDDLGGDQIDQQNALFGEAPTIRAGPRLRANRHALRGEDFHARTTHQPDRRVDPYVIGSLALVGAEQCQMTLKHLVKIACPYQQFRARGHV